MILRALVVLYDYLSGAKESVKFGLLIAVVTALLFVVSWIGVLLLVGVVVLVWMGLGYGVVLFLVAPDVTIELVENIR